MCPCPCECVSLRTLHAWARRGCHGGSHGTLRARGVSRGLDFVNTTSALSVRMRILLAALALATSRYGFDPPGNALLHGFPLPDPPLVAGRERTSLHLSCNRTGTTRTSMAPAALLPHALSRRALTSPSNTTCPLRSPSAMIHLNTSDITRERDDLRGVVQPADGSDDRTRDTARFQRALLGVNTL